jgi:hypothetical protein
VPAVTTNADAREKAAGLKLAGLWIAAAASGLAVAAVPVLDAGAPAHLMAALLLAVSLPFGLLRPSVPVLWAVAIGWPTVITRLGQDAGAGSAVLLVYPLIGVYAGDWIATWWAERYGRTRPGGRDAAPASGGNSRDADGLPPAVPGRWDAARRRAAEEAASGAVGRDEEPERRTRNRR